jgi:hypothetical protein
VCSPIALTALRAKLSTMADVTHALSSVSAFGAWLLPSATPLAPAAPAAASKHSAPMPATGPLSFLGFL